MENKGRPGLGEMRDESALNMFKQMDLKGKTQNDTQLKTTHQNTIATIRPYQESNGTISRFSCESSRCVTKRRSMLTKQQRVGSMGVLSSGLSDFLGVLELQIQWEWRIGWIVFR